MRNAGPAPMCVGRVSSASRHWADTSGYTGLPSIVTIEARSSSVETTAFHIIHAVVVNHRSRSPGPRSQSSPWFLKCSTRMPPCRCTIALGSPVVPDENSTYSGWSNGTASKRSGPDSRSSSSQPSEAGSASSAPPA
jgi:hypothetical protein